MRMLLAIVVLLAASCTITAAPPDNEPSITPERKALDKLWDAIRAEDAKAAQRAYEQFIRDFPAREATDEAAWQYACFHSRQGRLDNAQNLLLSLKRSGREN